MIGDSGLIRCKSDIESGQYRITQMPVELGFGGKADLVADAWFRTNLDARAQNLFAQ